MVQVSTVREDKLFLALILIYRRLNMKKIMMLLIISLITTGNLLLAQNQSFKIVVNIASPVSSISKTDISKFFLKKLDKWENGKIAVPVDQLENSPIREAFTKEIHTRSIKAVTSYWQQQMFSGRNKPPIIKNTDNEVLSYIKQTPDAIGYVSEKATTDGVKVIDVTE
jgi:hypothetical protein